MGGAPGNFVFHAHQLGHEAYAVSRVGADDLGQEIIARFGTFGLSARYLQVDSERPTGTVPVTLDEQGVPCFEIVEGVAWDHIDGEDSKLAELVDADLVCFGTLAQRHPDSGAAVRRLAESAQGLKFFDVNLRQDYWSFGLIEECLAITNVLKLNDDELGRLRRGEGGDDVSFCRGLISRFGLLLVCVTRGGQGSLLVTAEGTAEHPGVRAEVKDTVGAGDAFSAGIADGLLRGASLADMSAQANQLGAFVASRAGATPAHESDFRRVKRSFRGC